MSAQLYRLVNGIELEQKMSSLNITTASDRGSVADLRLELVHNTTIMTVLMAKQMHIYNCIGRICVFKSALMLKTANKLKARPVFSTKNHEQRALTKVKQKKPTMLWQYPKMLQCREHSCSWTLHVPAIFVLVANSSEQQLLTVLRCQAGCAPKSKQCSCYLVTSKLTRPTKAHPEKQSNSLWQWRQNQTRSVNIQSRKVEVLIWDQYAQYSLLSWQSWANACSPIQRCTLYGRRRRVDSVWEKKSVGRKKADDDIAQQHYRNKSLRKLSPKLNERHQVVRCRKVANVKESNG